VTDLTVLRSGLVDYDEAWARQRELADQVRREDRAFLWLLRHPPVFTIGRNGNAANILDPHGIPVRRVDRGGDVTYHGPGQIVGYPILRVRSIRRHIEGIEDVLIELTGGFRKPGCVGVWSPQGKIASIGVRVSRGVSMHGFALNVGGDLEPFSYIHPCGMAGCAVASVDRVDFESPLVEIFSRRFGLRIAEIVVR
jgi:lipoyl(octanoyl) transferase